MTKISKSTPTIEVQSEWKTMILGFIGKLIISTIICIYFGSMLAMRFFSDGINTKSNGIMVIAFIVLIVLAGWVSTYLVFFPKKWQQRATIDFEQEEIEITSGKSKGTLQFSEISQIRYKALSSVFNTSYLFFLTIDGTEKPLFALSDDAYSTDLFFALKNRTSIAVVQ